MDSKSIFGNVFRAGRPVLYNHRVQLNYKLPFQYLPYLDFIDAEVGYGFTYNWNARSTSLLNFVEPGTNRPVSLGSVGQNTNVIRLRQQQIFRSSLDSLNILKISMPNFRSVSRKWIP
jgi:cell surface protein SprA